MSRPTATRVAFDLLECRQPLKNTKMKRNARKNKKNKNEKKRNKKRGENMKKTKNDNHKIIFCGNSQNLRNFPSLSPDGRVGLAPLFSLDVYHTDSFVSCPSSRVQLFHTRFWFRVVVHTRFCFGVCGNTYQCSRVVCGNAHPVCIVLNNAQASICW